MDVDQAVRRFQAFLNQAFRAAEPALALEKGDASLNDWYQANWEQLVESVVCGSREFLEPYGEGADLDYSPASSRVSYPDRHPTHRVRVWPVNGTTVEDLLGGDPIEPQRFDFERFVNFDGSRYDDVPPFSGVLLSFGSELAVADASQVTFRLERAA